MNPTTLLRHAADVTPEWLTGALAGRGPAGRGRQGDLVRGGVHRHGPDGRHHPLHAHATTCPGPGPASVVGKFASADDQSRGTGLALRAYEIEVRFYREVAARVDARVPATYVAEVEPETGWFTLLLEDIAGRSRATRSRPVVPRSRRPSLEEMAGLHAPCWESPDLAGLRVAQPRPRPSPTSFLVAMVTSLLPGFLERYADTLAPEHQERLPASSPSSCPPTSGCATARARPATATSGSTISCSSRATRGPVVVDWQTAVWGGAVPRRRLLRRRLPQHRGPAGPRGRPAGPLPRRPVPARGARLLARAAAAPTPGGQLRRASSWPSSPP